jgi:hypothetical protein
MGLDNGSWPNKFAAGSEGGAGGCAGSVHDALRRIIKSSLLRAIQTGRYCLVYHNLTKHTGRYPPMA